MLILAPLWTQLTRRRGRGHAEAIYKVAKGTLERKAWTLATRLAVALCIVVYAVCLLFVGGLVWLTLRQFWVADFFAFLGCFVIGLAFSRTLSKRIPPLERREFPALYSLLDEVCAQLGHRSRVTLNLNPDFNAWYTQSLFGRPFIGLGLPLMYVLSGQERVSLIAHEVAHGVNSDIVRSRLMFFPLTLFATWYELLIPDALMQARATWGEGGGLTQATGNVATYLLSYLPLALLRLFHRLTMNESQLAEYRADFLESRVAGKSAALSSLDKLHFGSTYFASLHKQTLNPERAHLYAEFAHQMAQRSPQALAQTRQEIRERYTALDTHPPTVLRMQFIEEVAPSEALLELSETHNAKISTELERLIPALQREAIEQYRMRVGL